MEIPQVLVDEVRRRRDLLAREMDSRDLDVVVVASEGSSVYFTGYETSFWANKSRPLFVIVRPNAKAIVVCHAGEEPSIELDAVDVEVRPYAEPHVVQRDDMFDIDFHVAGAAQLVHVLKQIGATRVGMELGWYFVPTLTPDGLDALRRGLDGIELVDASPAIWKLRRRKSEWEIGMLRSAADMLSTAHLAFAERAQPGMCERQLSRLLHEVATQAGGERVPYAGVVAGTERAPLGGPTDRRWEHGQLLGVDLTLTVRNYHADFCRIYSAGDPSPQQVAAYGEMVRILERARGEVAPGNTIGAVASALFDGVDSAYARAGHGLGADMTEAPSISPLDDSPLESGMVFCLEPNRHFDGVGWLCAEETVLVTEDGCDLVSPLFPHSLEHLG